MDLMKLKSLGTARKTINKIRRQPSEWEKNNCRFNNWQRINLQNIEAVHTAQYQEKTNSPVKKWAEDLNKYFSKEDTQMINTQWKDAQHHSLLEKCKSKLQCGVTLYQSEWPSLKKNLQIINAGGYRERGTLLHCWWKCKLMQPLWRTTWRFL